MRSREEISREIERHYRMSVESRLLLELLLDVRQLLLEGKIL